MFKTVVTLMRGRAFEAEQRIKNQNALALLDQQMRDAAATVERARKALALAMAQERQEAQRLGQIRAQIVDLELRAVAALQGGREDLAEQAAQRLAMLEADADASARARQLFATEIGKLDARMRKQAARLAELERGRRIARVAHATRATRRGGFEPAHCCENTIADAEATLARLREQQGETEAAQTALDALSLAQGAENVAETLASEGFGPAKEPRAADILGRLKRKAEDGEKAAPSSPI
ncbi:MAG TPA: PspA/IM30 family protein [Methylocystis sp.]